MRCRISIHDGVLMIRIAANIRVAASISNAVTAAVCP